MSLSLTEAFAGHFLEGGHFNRITEARQFASQHLSEKVLPASALAKRVDEAIEAAVVRVAIATIQSAQSTHIAYDQLVDLLHRQPRLGVRSSTSVLQQAYSTPVPISYLASMLAGITFETTVYEPTAGNGALLMGANPQNVIANELNAERAAELQERGYSQLTQADATTYRPSMQTDVVICNPPFGTVKNEQGRTRRFRIYDTWTSQIDQAIALKALTVMKPNGSAALILGGKLGNSPSNRSARYNSRETRAFYHLLYGHYNVTQHISIAGELYRKQGAAFPIDIITIKGSGHSKRPLPAAELPTFFDSFHSLKEILPNAPIHRITPHVPLLQPTVLGLPNSLEANRNDESLHRSRTQRDFNTRRENLPGAEPDSVRSDDSRLGNGDFPKRNARATFEQLQSTGQRSAHTSSTNDGRQQHLEAGMGQSADSRQLALSGTDAALRRDANDANSAQQLGLFQLDRRSRQHSIRRMANDTHALETKTSEPQVSEIPKQAQEDSPLQPKQVAYVPKSQGSSTQTLIPYNMANAAQMALEQFERQHGSIDSYLMNKLGYASISELHSHFSAEQIDASALAISNIERGSGFITGDQTGIGKGRICASIIRYAQQTGMIAIFITKDKPLYADMMRDVHDIGLRDFTPFVTDSSAEIPLANGGQLTTLSAARQKKAMTEMARTQQLNGYSAVFTTYSQLQTVRKKEPLRREFLRAIAPKAVLILDEAHQAGGSPNTWKVNGPPDRAAFVRELVDLSQGVFYSSATYAKRPDVMDLYARRTDLRKGVKSMASLESILHRGGVPLQQIVASKLVAASHMLRRERSYEGVSFRADVVSVDRDVADQFSAAMRAIRDFDRAKQEAVKVIKEEVKAQAKALGPDAAVGEMGVKSTNFTSLMHNCIEQGLLAQKADATVQAAIASLEKGEKPVIAVANTMGSFIKAYADTNDLAHGNEIALSFSDLLERYLERSRDVLIRDYRAVANRHRLTDEELGHAGVKAYENALECIRAGDFYSIPISPIDYIEQQLERAGYSVAEVTGRKVGLEYDADGSATYRIRPAQASTAKGKIEAVARFNAGQADVILLNCSGSTGISLHASEKFADQRPRHMIVAQAERDINVFMQMLGRIHRTGQVALPNYTLLIGDIPAEKRPGALLCRKMASLNANTTAARESDISIQNVVDFMNAYGEQVVNDLLKDDADLNAQLDYPLTQVSEADGEIALVRKVTGRIPLLPIGEQEKVYGLIESEYQELVARARAMGESDLEAGQLDLDARTVARVEVVSVAESVGQNGNGSAARLSDFSGAVYLEVIDAKVLAKPMTQLQVIDAVRKRLNLSPVLDVAKHNVNQSHTAAQQQRAERVEQLDAEVSEYRSRTVVKKKDVKAIAKFNEKLNLQRHQVTTALEKFIPGRTVQVRISELGTGETLFGVVESLEKKRKSENPVALHAWKMRILIAGPAQELVVPLSNINTDRLNALRLSLADYTPQGEGIYALFDKAQAVQRERYQMFTGNLIKAFEKYPRGKFVNYTDDQGKVRQGLMMHNGFELAKAMESEPVALPNPEMVRAFITTLTDGRGAVKTLDEILTLKKMPKEEGFVLETPKAKAVGGKYYLDQALLAAVEGDFYSVGDRMTVPITPSQLDTVLEVLMNQRNYTFAAFEFKEIAREQLGIALPSFEALDQAIGKDPVESEPIKSLLSRVAEPQALSPPTETKAETKRETRSPIQLARAPAQRNTLEGQAIHFLKEAGLWETVSQDRDFHFKILNEPYIPLVIERLGDDLLFTHYLSQNGDTYIDTEMVFTFQEKESLKFKEVAVPNALQGGELRGYDRAFAKIFTTNIVEQGFVEAAREQFQDSEKEADRAEGGKAALSPIAEPSLQEIADEVREADLEGVAVELGLERDGRDKHKWRDGDHIISISDRLFMDWLADKGGGGAIDLVMHVRDCEFKAAVEWLSGRSFSGPVVVAVAEKPHSTEEPKVLVMPEANENRWAAVEQYLVETRKLSLPLVERLHEKGLIYADDFQNAVFVRHGLEADEWQRGAVSGASLRGTWGEQNAFWGMAPGTKRDKGWFWLGAGRGHIQRVLIAESPIDVMSLAMLDKQRNQQSVTIYLSVDGTGAAPIERLRPLLTKGTTVKAAFDSDKAGECMAWRLAQQLPGIGRLIPTEGKDWNEQLAISKGEKQQSAQSAEQSAEQSADFNRAQSMQLWRWHRAAVNIGRSAPYLERITEVSISAISRDEALSEKATVAMKTDLQAAKTTVRQREECCQT